MFRAQTAIREEQLAPVAVRSDSLEINEKLGYGEKSKLEHLCQRFKDRFAGDPKRPETTVKENHYINTGRSPPIKQRPRKFLPGWEREIERQVKEMIKNGICRASKSPWASKVVLVKKRDGSFRFAIDYRQLNDVTKKDAYSLPNPQHILDKLRVAKLFTKLDVASAYWCVPVHISDIEKTAFYTPRGQYEMLVMPFGLCNSQATYQRLMDQTLAGLERVESFVDDCLIYSESFEEHLQDIESVFKGLGKRRSSFDSKNTNLGSQRLIS